MRRAWNVRLAGLPPVRLAGAGIDARMMSASRPVLVSGAGLRSRTSARAIRPANLSSPNSRSTAASRSAGYVLTTCAAVSSRVLSIRMSSGAS